MASLNVFTGEAFSLTNMTAAINKLPYKPRLLQMLNIFEQIYVSTDDVWVEERNGKLSILPQAARNTINAVRSQPARKARNFKIPHVPQHQTVMASDIANIRAFGSESELEAVTPIVNDQLQGMKDNHDVTHEYHRIGALKGTISDGDTSATTIYNLFTEFGVTQSEIDFEYAYPDYNYVCSLIIREIAGKLGGTPFGQIYAICGNDYFDAVKQHTSNKTAWERWRDGEYLRTQNLGPEWYSVATSGVLMHGIMHINYRGEIDAIKFMADDEAYFFPSNVPGLFQEIYGPANFMETVNTRAQSYYAKQRMLPFDTGMELHTQSNMLAMCTRPSAVVKSSVTNFSGTSTA